MSWFARIISKRSFSGGVTTEFEHTVIFASESLKDLKIKLRVVSHGTSITGPLDIETLLNPNSSIVSHKEAILSLRLFTWVTPDTRFSNISAII